MEFLAIVGFGRDLRRYGLGRCTFVITAKVRRRSGLDQSAGRTARSTVKGVAIFRYE
jgi:hypothetical protein